MDLFYTSTTCNYIGLWLRLSQIVLMISDRLFKIIEKEKEIKIDKHHLP